MTDTDTTDRTPLQRELDALGALIGDHLDRLSIMVEGISVDQDVTRQLEEAQAELRAAHHEHRVRLAMVESKYAAARDGALQGVAPLPAQLEALHASELFDPDWYLEANEDLRAAGVDPADHYARSGGFEGRDPGPGFATLAYYLANPDVAESGWPALVHYEMYGRAEGRRTAP